ncbi:hypothetical protein CDD81_5434 [Ophiocordyceps australis]|uniref:Protein SQS1 n=1 Tax=Ophiocordyceps australis TaxID=1399860 RepID=A0A2C5XPZ4_9HYPO|nr:hypothetical protein CDD81_5434 [Ophiocordyceps australis]
MDRASASNCDQYHASSNSSDDEVILFQGRNQHTRATKKNVVENASDVETRNHGGIGLTVQLFQSRRNSCRGGRGRIHQEASDDSSVLDDYVANIRENDPLIQRTRNTVAQRYSFWLSPKSETNTSMERITGTELVQNTQGQYEIATEPEPHGHMSGNDVSTSHATTDGDTTSVSEDSEPSDEGIEINQSRAYSIDWEGLSLRTTKAGRVTHAIANPGDADMERKLHMAWKKDCLRKKKRKQHREELRSIGALGQSKLAQDMRVKYPLGMSIEQIAYEMRRFLIDKVQILPFPPMDPQARRTVHELAGRFKIKSKSKGHADQRQPTLYRTRKTLAYVESTFNQAMACIGQRHVRRPAVKNRKRDNRQLGQNHNKGAASYKEGDIVGGRAPELGAHNRGRAILEKMGWSSGTALGAMHNKGILQPVTQAVKRSKAGLG